MKQRSMWQSGIVLAAVAFFFGAFPSARAASTSWSGATSAAWATGTNWSSGTAPGATTGTTSTDVATFFTNPANGTTTPLTIDAGRNLSGISFDTGAGAFTFGSAGANGGPSLLVSSGGIVQFLSTFTGTGVTETFNAPLVMEGATTTALTFKVLTPTASGNAFNITGGITSGAASGTSTLVLGSGTNVAGVASTISGVIADGTSGANVALNVIQGAWALSGNNTFTGGVTLHNATLDINSATALGTGTLTIQNGATTTIDNTSGGALTLSGANAITASSLIFIGTNDLNLGTGAFTIGNNHPAFTINAGTLGIGGSVVASGTSSSTKAGAGALALWGDNTSDTQGWILSAGTLDINSATALGSGTFLIDAGTTIDNTSSGAVALTLLAPEKWNGAFTFAGTHDLDLGASTVALQTNSAVTVTQGTLTVGGVISGSALSLTKNGAGTLALGGADTYTGGTIVNAGTLLISSTGSINNTSTTAQIINGGTLLVSAGGSVAGTSLVNAGNLIVNGTAGVVSDKATAGNTAFLGGSGTFTGAVSVGNAVAGTSSIINAGGVGAVGTMTFNSTLSLIANSTLQFDLNSSTSAIDSFLVTGKLTLGAGVASLVGTDLGNATLALGTVLKLIQYGSFTAGGTFLNQADGSDLTIGSNIYQINYGTLAGNANAITLEVVGAVPEPSTWALLGFGAFGLFAVVRRRAA